MKKWIATRALPAALGFNYTMFVVFSVLACETWLWNWPNYWVGLSLVSLGIACLNAILLGIYSPEEPPLAAPQEEMAFGFTINQDGRVLCNLVVELQPRGLFISNVNGYDHGDLLVDTRRYRCS